jgi:hypothetical protein
MIGKVIASFRKSKIVRYPDSADCEPGKPQFLSQLQSFAARGGGEPTLDAYPHSIATQTTIALVIYFAISHIIDR